MGNRDSVHVQIIETIPLLGLVPAMFHGFNFNNKQTLRAFGMNFLSIFCIGGIYKLFKTCSIQFAIFGAGIIQAALAGYVG